MYSFHHAEASRCTDLYTQRISCASMFQISGQSVNDAMFKKVLKREKKSQPYLHFFSAGTRS